MSILRIQDFNKLIEFKKIPFVYLLAGEETYLIDLCLGKIQKLLAVDDLNKEIFYAANSNSEDILNAVLTLPLLSGYGRRLIVVKDVNKMRTADIEQIICYLSEPADSSCLVLIYNGNYKKETVVKRKELINTCMLSKNCVSVDCRKQYENEAKEFIKSELAARGKTASCNLISRIVNENGTDLLNISNEIEKLSLYAGKESKEITESDLEKAGGYTKEINVYTLSSSIESKNMPLAVFILEKLFRDGREPVIILSVLASSIRKMLSAKSMLEEQNMSVSNVASAVKIHHFYAKQFFLNLKKHTIKSLKSDLKAVLKADKALKTGSNDPLSCLEKLIVFICS
ncbi:MAG: DNA polymerase III subunit delta [Endomicrobium sp.]|nr:DNA polymerase III subunit delta [Endomicrobium sp.]